METKKIQLKGYKDSKEIQTARRGYCGVIQRKTTGGKRILRTGKSKGIRHEVFCFRERSLREKLCEERKKTGQLNEKSFSPEKEKCMCGMEEEDEEGLEKRRTKEKDLEKSSRETKDLFEEFAWLKDGRKKKFEKNSPANFPGGRMGAEGLEDLWCNGMERKRGDECLKRWWNKKEGE